MLENKAVKLIWNIEDSDIQKVRSFYDQYKDSRKEDDRAGREVDIHARDWVIIRFKWISLSMVDGFLQV